MLERPHTSNVPEARRAVNEPPTWYHKNFCYDDGRTCLLDAELDPDTPVTGGSIAWPVALIETIDGRVIVEAEVYDPEREIRTSFYFDAGSSAGPPPAV